MYTSTFTSFFLAAAGTALSASIPVRSNSGSVSITPHAEYSSSIGVLGCKINTDRVAYWPGSIGCDDICVKLTNQGRSVHVLRVDSSGGAHDVSYDAWNYLGFGQSATEDPQEGGGITVDYEVVDPSECSSLLSDGKLPLSAANSINYLVSCLSQPNSWVAKNYELRNILNPVCTLGFDEVCELDLSVSNQPSCPHTLGLNNPLTDLPVTNIDYGTGKKSVAQ
ncbi:hypothetical protein VTK73DRAFT_8373 [Phialemonium thermophilum]|uniref:Cerato-platanin n=1 Tax=Phialemonium thermophilum TaxID=223376 RepID=A0ABR3XPD2_9PEZI